MKQFWSVRKSCLQIKCTMWIHQNYIFKCNQIDCRWYSSSTNISLICPFWEESVFLMLSKSTDSLILQVKQHQGSWDTMGLYSWALTSSLSYTAILTPTHSTLHITSTLTNTHLIYQVNNTALYSAHRSKCFLLMNFSLFLFLISLLPSCSFFCSYLFMDCLLCHIWKWG